jgi:hypothetical protein
VDCSWVTTRGTGERFLYYDGPTLTRLPLQFALRDGAVEVAPVPGFADETMTLKLPVISHAMRVTVVGDNVRADRLSIPRSFPEPTLRPDPKPVRGDPAAEFLWMIRQSGLAPAESDAMLACWRKEFFQTPGDRLLLFFDRAEYDRFCPLEVRPTPTQIVRVGVIWIELPSAGK